MLPKETISKKSRVTPNHFSPNSSKKKTSSAQTENSDYFYITNEENFIKTNGEISRNVQDNYKRAVDYVNKWNNVMNEYLKQKSNKKQDLSSGECNDMRGSLKITCIPNFMAFFSEIFQNSANHNNQLKISEQINSFTQTAYPSEKNNSSGRSSAKSRNSITLLEIDEDASDIENIPKITRSIQETQYKNYPPRRCNSTTPTKKNKIFQNSSFEEENSSPPSRCSEGNIRRTTPNIFGKEVNHNPGDCNSQTTTTPKNNSSKSSLRRNQSYGNVPAIPSKVFQLSQRPTGLLSTNGMIASKINAKGTPLIVKNMFEGIQYSPDGNLSKGNILTQFSKNANSSNSSVILSDKDSRESKINDGNEEKECSRQKSSHILRTNKAELEELTPPHPLQLNERDLNTADRNFINSLGIFTEAGELKQKAKTYLNKKEDVRRGLFRAPRVSQLHVTTNYNAKSCTSGSLISDILSAQSSDIRSDV